MTYQDLDINQKINLKAALEAWSTYSVEHFQAEIVRKVYGIQGLKTTKKGVQRTSIIGYRFGAGKSRTKQLQKAWWKRVQLGSTDKVVLEFMLYGRFVDMGVGRGVSHTDRQVNRALSLGPTSRKRKPWYSKRKSYEVKRLREILAAQHLHLNIDTVENALTLTVALNR